MSLLFCFIKNYQQCSTHYVCHLLCKFIFPSSPGKPSRTGGVRGRSETSFQSTLLVNHQSRRMNLLFCFTKIVSSVLHTSCVTCLASSSSRLCRENRPGQVECVDGVKLRFKAHCWLIIKAGARACFFVLYNIFLKIIGKLKNKKKTTIFCRHFLALYIYFLQSKTVFCLLHF